MRTGEATNWPDKIRNFTRYRGGYIFTGRSGKKCTGSGLKDKATKDVRATGIKSYEWLIINEILKRVSMVYNP